MYTVDAQQLVDQTRTYLCWFADLRRNRSPLVRIVLLDSIGEQLGLQTKVSALVMARGTVGGGQNFPRPR